MYVLAGAGQGTVEAIQAFLKNNCKHKKSEGLLRLAARVELLLQLQTSCDDYGAFEALSTAMRDRVLMATDTDVFVQDVVPLLFPGLNLLKISKKSGNQSRFLLDDGKKYVWQRDRMLIKKPGTSAYVYDAAARSDERRMYFGWCMLRCQNNQMYFGWRMLPCQNNQNCCVCSSRDSLWRMLADLTL